ncbi:MBL fold metallo-hydrolase [Cystobacter ferrugineus]|uniref:MBL fold metallo-hydrolase n=1 Tax=Cystobacter ferrugineus TaxID=83449 RepID=A0A1L9B1S7_9BACT|nr:MBL fold metallo-hydrolase [Cystobacter ferrugineus]OJH36218.1 MBL fold metallo-hydrolase [Cystobacter ferrugineus]
MTMRTISRSATLAALLSVTGGLFTAPAQAAAPLVKTQAPGFYRMMLGDFEITALLDGTVTLPVVKDLTNVKPGRAEALLAAEFLTSSVETSINAYLINTGARLFLVDTGAGELIGPSAGQLVTSIRAAGYQPEQVDAVLLTHAHPDHSGGLVVAGKRVFPNARVYADKREVDYWLSSANAEKAPESLKPLFQEAKDSLTPYAEAGHLETFTGNTQLAPGLRTLESPGHTPGHTFYVVESQGQKLVFWGDVMHVAAVQFPEPSVSLQYDADSKAAAAQRAKAYAEAARQGYWLAIDHVSFPGLGHLRANGKGYTWVPANYSTLR